jgi:hypothetical protein
MRNFNQSSWVESFKLRKTAARRMENFRLLRYGIVVQRGKRNTCLLSFSVVQRGGAESSSNRRRRELLRSEKQNLHPAEQSVVELKLCKVEREARSSRFLRNTPSNFIIIWLHSNLAFVLDGEEAGNRKWLHSVRSELKLLEVLLL